MAKRVTLSRVVDSKGDWHYLGDGFFVHHDPTSNSRRRFIFTNQEGQSLPVTVEGIYPDDQDLAEWIPDDLRFDRPRPLVELRQ